MHKKRAPKLQWVGLFFVGTFGLIPGWADDFQDSSPWQSAYVGIYAGGAFSHQQVDTNVGSADSTTYFSSDADANAVSNAGSFSHHSVTALGGFQAGQDWTFNRSVFGLVMDYSAFRLNASKNITNAIYPDSTDTYSISTSMNTNWMFTFRTRLGYLSTLHHWPSLFYLTAGPVLTKVKMQNTFSDSSSSLGNGGEYRSSYQLGWTAGAGLEVLSWKNLAINVEYLYLQIPSADASSSILNTQGGFGIPSGSQTSPFATTGKFSENLVKIGLNYRFK